MTRTPHPNRERDKDWMAAIAQIQTALDLFDKSYWHELYREAVARKHNTRERNERT